MLHSFKLGIKEWIYSQPHYSEKILTPSQLAHFRSEALLQGCPLEVFNTAIDEITVSQDERITAGMIEHQITFLDNLVPVSLSQSLRFELDKLPIFPDTVSTDASFRIDPFLYCMDLRKDYHDNPEFFSRYLPNWRNKSRWIEALPL